MPQYSCQICWSKVMASCALIEPLLIVFLGVVVGGIVICMFLPIFKLSELVSKKH